MNGGIWSYVPPNHPRQPTQIQIVAEFWDAPDSELRKAIDLGFNDMELVAVLHPLFDPDIQGAEIFEVAGFDNAYIRCLRIWEKLN